MNEIIKADYDVSPKNKLHFGVEMSLDGEYYKVVCVVRHKASEEWGVMMKPRTVIFPIGKIKNANQAYNYRLKKLLNKTLL